MPTRSARTLLLVHGAWHGSWCWAAVEPGFTAAGWSVRSVDLPSMAGKGAPRHGLHDDADAVRAALAAADGPVTVLAHSYGGAPASEGAAGLPHVERLIYLAAFPLDRGESILGAGGGTPPAIWNVDGDTVTPHDPVGRMYHDVPTDVAERIRARLLPQSMTAQTETLHAAAWHDVPADYIVCTNDRALPVSAQQRLAARCARTHRLPTGHSPFVSRPREFVALVNRIADTAGACPENPKDPR